jgi:hypothetical protein
MAPAHGLAVLQDLLGISAIQIQEAVGHEDGGEAEKKSEQADVYPRKSHGTPLRQID